MVWIRAASSQWAARRRPNRCAADQGVTKKKSTTTKGETSMKRTNYMTLAVSMAMLCGLTAAQAADNLEKESQEAVANFLQKDSTLKPFLDNAAGHAIFPNVGKGGLIVGGAHGEGLVYE